MSNVLCVDVGGTRIKAAIFERNVTSLENIKLVQTKTIRSLGWLNQTLPELLSNDHWASLTHRNINFDNFDSVSVAIPDKVVDNGTKIEGHLVSQGVPSNLKGEFERKISKEVFLMNDAEAWLRGTIKYCKLMSTARQLSFPIACLTFGTGVGFSYSRTASDIVNLEISNMGGSWRNLQKASDYDIDGAWKVHKIMGDEFFSWVRNEKKDWSYQTIRKEYTKRILGFLKDVTPHLKKERDEFRTLFVGGGNAEYVSISDLEKIFGLKVIPLTKEKLEINPDLIPLIGLIKE